MPADNIQSMKNQPFIRLVLPLMFGILVQCYLNADAILLIVFLVISFLLYFLSGIVNRAAVYEKYTYLAVFIFVFALGMFSVELNKVKFNYTTGREVVLLATVDNVPKPKNAGLTTVLKINAIKVGDEWLKQHFKVNAFFSDFAVADSLKAGADIVFTGELYEIEGPKNPFDFNYKKYLKNKDVLYSVQLERDQWNLLNGETNHLFYMALNTRMKIINLYEKAGIYGDELGVLSALTFGYKDKLETAIKESYSGAGAMHVLAVSGLHVAIVYKLVQLLLGFLRLFKNSKAFLNTTIILSLWFYAFMAGLSPSVIRATIMFSFVLSARIINKQSNIYNSLAAAAFVMLVVSPQNIFDVGFQLSFIAVGGIVFLYQHIYNLFYFKFKLFDWLWALTSVSIAAQLATLPLTLYYFKNFSSYFWLTSSVVTIAAFILIIGAVVLIIFSATPFMSFIGATINFIIKWLNIFIARINELPGAHLSNVNLSPVQVVCLFAGIFLLALWIMNKNTRNLLVSLSFGLVFICIGQWNLVQRNQLEVLCIYHVPNARAMQYISKNQSYWMVDDNSGCAKNVISKANKYWMCDTSIYIKPNQKTDSLPVFIKEQFIGIGPKRGMIVSNNYPYIRSRNIADLNLDFIVIGGKNMVETDEILHDFSQSTIVFNGAVPNSNKASLVSSMGNKIYSISKQGAFIIDTDN